MLESRASELIKYSSTFEIQIRSRSAAKYTFRHPHRHRNRRQHEHNNSDFAYSATMPHFSTKWIIAKYEPVLRRRKIHNLEIKNESFAFQRNAVKFARNNIFDFDTVKLKLTNSAVSGSGMRSSYTRKDTLSRFYLDCDWIDVFAARTPHLQSSVRLCMPLHVCHT